MLDFLQRYYPIIVAVLLLVTALVVVFLLIKKHRTNKTSSAPDFYETSDEAEESEEENLLPTSPFKTLPVAKSFEEKLVESEEGTKIAYATIVKALKDLKMRRSKKMESFRKDGKTLAKLTFSGKTLKLYLALSPSILDEKEYRHEDASKTSMGKDTPTAIKLRNKLALKKAVEMINIMLEQK